MEQQIKITVDRIFALYDKYGAQDYGERVSMLMHMMQCAQIAQAAGEDEEMILAAFLHDIGHFFEDDEKMDVYGTRHHDDLGGQYLLELGFPQRMADLVSSHVAAKKYLVYAEPSYYETLSDASKATLEFQGGKMTAAEAAEFEQDPLAPLHVKIRRWDDTGKDADKTVSETDVEQMKGMAYRYLLNMQSASLNGHQND